MAAAPDEPRDPPAPPAPQPVREYRGTGISVAVVLGFVLAIAVVIFVVQNTGGVRLEWIVWEADVSLAAVVLGGLATGALLSAVVGVLWRRQRRRSLSDREELERLRSERPS